jgi:ABC-type multidrug transport system fused ATPase/permease subunit
MGSRRPWLCYFATNEERKFFLQGGIVVAIALEVMGAYKTFYEIDDEQQRPWWRFWDRPARREVIAVNRVSFAVRQGEIYGILGPNGSGEPELRGPALRHG